MTTGFALMTMGFAWSDIIIVISVSLLICITVCALAMEAAVLFIPSFLFLFPRITSGFPAMTPNAAIGLALVIEAFGYTSSVLGYWYRKQISWRIAGLAIILTIPLALALRVVSYFIQPGGLMLTFGTLLLILAVVLHRTHNARVDTIGSDISTAISFDKKDWLAVGAAGFFAGLVGIAVGEIMNTLLFLRKRLPLRQSVGTSAAILHLTIFSATILNLLILAFRPAGLHTEGIDVPWSVAVFIIPTVIAGGQIGAYLNSRLYPGFIHRVLVSVYGMLGIFVLAQASGIFKNI